MSLAVMVMALAGALAFISSVWMIIAAFSAGILWGLAYLFIPFAQLVFLFVHWKKAAKPFFLGLFAVFLGGAALFFYARNADPDQKKKLYHFFEQVQRLRHERNARTMESLQGMFSSSKRQCRLPQNIFKNAPSANNQKQCGFRFTVTDQDGHTQKFDFSSMLNQMGGKQNPSTTPKASYTNISQGTDSLFHAVRNCQMKAVQSRLDAGENINKRSQLNETPLMEAAALGCEDVVRLLVARGADTSLKNSQGQTALMIAKENFRTKIAEFLEGKNGFDFKDPVSQEISVNSQQTPEGVSSAAAAPDASS